MSAIKEHYHEKNEAGMRGNAPPPTASSKRFVPLAKGDSRNKVTTGGKKQIPLNPHLEKGDEEQRELPLLFSTPMVIANLEKRKSQTRRTRGLKKINENPDQWKFLQKLTRENKVPVYRFKNTESGEIIELKSPYGEPGDWLWVREAWGFYNGSGIFGGNLTAPSKKEGCEGWAESIVHRAGTEKYGWGMYGEPTWRPSIHMPKEAARLWLENVEITLERVADISEEDAIAEGVIYDGVGHEWICYDNTTCCFETAKESFRSLWQSINGKPKPIQHKSIIDGKLQTLSYTVYPFDSEAAKAFSNRTGWNFKPLQVIINPWVWVVKYKELSRTGKPQMCYKTNELCKYDCKGLCRENM
jgi:hypothetical protein